MTLKPNLEVGPFRLAEMIGEGGMGEVWRAVHHRHETAVAIKVITSTRASQPKYRESFQREVQAVAALNHPGVVAIFDYGELIAPAEEITLPWYAMEIADTSLAEVRIGDWPTLRRILVEILDALAHAHARGVIHRDLKPENVLLNSRLETKLTDFGMAHVVEFTDDTNNIFGPGGGTPDFMSPEQFRGEWRKFGPWTDLYAVGCMAWELASGSPPFAGKSVVEIAMQHMNAKPPKLQAQFEVPERFELWLQRLMQKHPLDRYRRAADAQWALVHDVGDVGNSDEARATLRSRPGSPTTSEDILDTLEHEPLPRRRDSVTDPNQMTLQVSYGLTPPFPASWSTEHVASRLGGAGLGLFGIREIPFVGREHERQAVWDRLRAVDANERNEALFIFGEPGIGRSRFGQWISRRAHELGAATVIRAVHSPIPGRSDGLSGAVTRFLGIEGVDAKRARDIVTDRLGPAFNTNLLIDLLFQSGSDESTGTSTFAAPAQRFAAVERLFRALSWERPVIFVADDVQWGADTLLFIEHLLGSDRGRTLVIANVRPDALPDRYWESQLVDELRSNERSSAIQLSPLSVDERYDLIGQMLDLDSKLAEKVVKRSQGIPLFAVQLVGDWVQRGLLEETAEGFRLKRGASIDLPDDVYALWTQRIDDLSNNLGSDKVREILEVAALLGGGTNGEWVPACAKLGYRIPADLEDQLVSRRLAARDANGWSFQHGMLRESLERSATESGRATAIYGACADVLDRSDPYRLAEFQVRAGRFDDAVESLLQALDIGVVTLAIDQSLQVAELVEELLQEVATGPSDERFGRLKDARVNLERLRGEFETAKREAESLVDEAERYGWRTLGGYGHLHLGMLGELSGDDRRTVLGHFDEALATFDELDDDRGRARAYRSLADYHMANGKPDVSSNLTQKALTIMNDQNDVDGVVECAAALGASLAAAGEIAEAREWYESARDNASVQGLRHFIAEATCGLARLDQQNGDLDLAEEGYLEAEELWDSIGSHAVFVARANRGLLELDRGEMSSAREHLANAAEELRSGTVPGLRREVDAGLLVCHAHTGDTDAFDGVFESLEAVPNVSNNASIAVASRVFDSGKCWADRSDRTRARKAYDFARNRFMALGAQKLADDVAIAIGSL